MVDDNELLKLNMMMLLFWLHEERRAEEEEERVSGYQKASGEKLSFTRVP